MQQENQNLSGGPEHWVNGIMTFAFVSHILSFLAPTIVHIHAFFPMTGNRTNIE